MARSYKKTPILKDNNKVFQKLAAKKARKAADIADGNSYRKHGDQYNVRDWRFVRNAPAEGQDRNAWEKAFKRK